MKKSMLSPLMIAGLALVLVLASGCNRPDQQATLDTPVPVGPQVQATLPPAVEPTPTLPVGEMPVDLAATVAAAGTPPAEATALAPVPSAPETTPLAPEAQPTAIVVASTPEPTVVPTLAPLSPTGERIHTVQSGERLFSIARLYNVNPYAIAQLNGIPAPYLIYPGQKLKIPGAGGATPVPVPVTPQPGGTTYKVQPGDNLFRIALRFGRSMQSIAAANGIANYNLIYPGQVLRIP